MSDGDDLDELQIVIGAASLIAERYGYRLRLERRAPTAQSRDTAGPMIRKGAMNAEDVMWHRDPTTGRWTRTP